MQLLYIRYNFAFVLLLLFTASCAPPKIKEPQLSIGSINFDRYIAFGNDYTSGELNFGVYEGGQQYSFPNLFANQVKKLRPCTFHQPLIPKGDDRYWYLQDLNALNDTCASQATLQSLKQIGKGHLSDSRGTFHNFGAPCIDICNIHSFINCPYLTRLSDTSYTYLELINHAKPTFFTVELGFNECWTYATFDNVRLTSPDVFKSRYREMLDSLTKHTPDGVLITIPDLTLLPYIQEGKKYYSNTQSCELQPFYIRKDAIIRQSKPSDNIPLYHIINSIEGNDGLGSQNNPLPYVLILDSVKALTLQKVTTSYNTAIKDLALEYNLPVVDLAGFMKEWNKSPVMSQGISMDMEYLRGELLSVDGYTFSPRGNALFTNELIKVVNRHYGSQIPLLNISDFPTLNISEKGQSSSSNSSAASSTPLGNK